MHVICRKTISLLGIYPADICICKVAYVQCIYLQLGWQLHKRENNMGLVKLIMVYQFS